MKEIINMNIRFLREQAGWTQKELAAKTGIKKPMIGAYEEFRSVPVLTAATKIADAFNVDLDSLVRRHLGKTTPKKSIRDKYKRGREVLAITVDQHTRENVEFINQKASAGYLSSFSDPEYMKELPKISLPFLAKNKTYRAFEITGDSMLPVQPGSIIVGEYVDNLSTIKNGECCVIVTKDEGVSYKRVYNFLASAARLMAVSDNTVYEPYTINHEDILEVWKKSKIITDTVVSDREAINGNQLASLVLTLQGQMKKLKRR